MKNFFSSLVASIPREFRLPLLCVLLWEVLVYNGSRIFTEGLYHYDFTTSIDTATPFLPWTVSIYLSCYLFWVVNYILACRQSRERAWTFLAADFIAKIVCLLCFVILPTTNIRPEVGSSTIWELLMRLVYRLDAPNNLFPSIHCLASWFSFIAVRKNERVPRWYRCFSLVFALMICASTLTTKQHVWTDVFGGVLLAEGSWQLVRKSQFFNVYHQIFERRKTI